ncbi:hypothetical protein CYMTET_18562 [Cymbomonas tetramitiformis]|uniref:Uncharacterized protein n=1 Tax=Cymbomonas tetramitiformis TaxID=36881 RepID=A0AAE0G822_9CHLO|nr:hypothetical protein CYMTET_18562 [Cymbomonas tetramitiformis]
MEDVYGTYSEHPDLSSASTTHHFRIRDTPFPKPLPENEAGKGLLGQRRYLWTDAFGVLNYVTLARLAEEAGSSRRRTMYLRSARALIDAVHTTLGNPTSENFPMAKAVHGDALQPMFQYKGLRIGKVQSRETSDAGMLYDGMYWHYLAKWIFALARYATESSDYGVLVEANMLIHDVHPAFFRPDCGMLWKVNVDLSCIPGATNAVDVDDTLSAWIVYNAVQAAATKQPSLVHLEKEIDEVRKALMPRLAQQAREVQRTFNGDALGWGMHVWMHQWLGSWADEWRATIIHPNVTARTLDVDSGMLLPFRLYGGLLGAKLSGEESLMQQADHILTKIVDGGMHERVTNDSITCINKVMFAAAFAPLAFAKLPDEPVLNAPSDVLHP